VTRRTCYKITRIDVCAETSIPVDQQTVCHEIAVPDPQRWSPDSPALYEVDVRLLHDGLVMDAMTERIGFVKLSTRGRQFLINGEPYYLRGTGDFLSCPETGCPDTDRDRWRRKLRALRDYGYNYVRCQSYVYGPEYYDIADEVGNLTGKLTTDFMDDGSEIESELTGYAFDQINDALLGEVKKQLR